MLYDHRRSTKMRFSTEHAPISAKMFRTWGALQSATLLTLTMKYPSSDWLLIDLAITITKISIWGKLYSGDNNCGKMSCYFVTLHFGSLFCPTKRDARRSDGAHYLVPFRSPPKMVEIPSRPKKQEMPRNSMIRTACKFPGSPTHIPIA